MDNRGNRRMAKSRTAVYGFSDSEYIDAEQLRARQKKPARRQLSAEEEASQYGFSKNVAKRSGKKGRKAKKVNHLKLRVVFGILAALIGALVGVVWFGFWYKDYLLNQITYETDDPTQVITIVNDEGETVELSQAINSEATSYEVLKDDPVKNFLLIGIDSRSKSYNKDGKGDRSDVIVVMSVDTKNETIKLLSIARDSYAYFPGYSKPHKINASMSYGGPKLLQATVENCLRIKIDGYAYVNFSHMAKIIDAVGGVYVNMTSGEKRVANQYIRELYPNAALIESTGDGTWVNGIQAVAYARVRYVGNGDYERMERQIEVLRSLMKRYMKLSATQKLACMDDVLGAIVTNIPKEDVEKYALEFLPSLQKAEMQYLQLPIEGCYNQGTYDGEWSMRVNWNAFIPYVQQYFYGQTTDFDPVKLPSHVPELSKCKTNIPLEKLVH
ncbi:MAG: LCP family protein [Clostridiales bacterium]|nr:LCP family protein [Clostridiales bacterium]